MPSSPLASLPVSARNAVAEIVRLLSARFTGRITIDATEGGVRSLEVAERLDGRALEQRRQRAEG